jgi:hypothetical protein
MQMPAGDVHHGMADGCATALEEAALLKVFFMQPASR